jgi:hypothetical protein
MFDASYGSVIIRWLHSNSYTDFVTLTCLNCSWCTFTPSVHFSSRFTFCYAYRTRKNSAPPPPPNPAVSCAPWTITAAFWRITLTTHNELAWASLESVRVHSSGWKIWKIRLKQRGVSHELPSIIPDDYTTVISCISEIRWLYRLKWSQSYSSSIST